MSAFELFVGDRIRACPRALLIVVIALFAAMLDAAGEQTSEIDEKRACRVELFSCQTSAIETKRACVADCAEDTDSFIACVRNCSLFTKNTLVQCRADFRACWSPVTIGLPPEVVVEFEPPTTNTPGIWFLDNAKITAQVQALDPVSSVVVGFFHSDTKTRSFSVALSAPDYTATLETRVPLLPLRDLTNNDLRARLGYQKGNDFVLTDELMTGWELDGFMRYRKMWFHNTSDSENPSDRTSLVFADVQRHIDNVAFVINEGKGIDDVYGHCGLINQFGTWNRQTNDEDSKFTIVDEITVPATCRDLWMQPNYDAWEANCRDSYHEYVNQIDPNQDYVHVFVLPRLRTSTQCGFHLKGPNGEKNIVFMKESNLLSSSSRCLAHEVGHSLGLGHRSCTSDPECEISLASLDRNLMCGGGGCFLGYVLTDQQDDNQCFDVWTAEPYTDWND